jgi:integrase
VCARLDAAECTSPEARERVAACLLLLEAGAAGMDPAEFGGHRLGAGFVTSAAERGARPDRIMPHTGHKSAAMLRGYTRHVDSFADHAGEWLL